MKLFSDCCSCDWSRYSFQLLNYSPSRFYEIHTCNTFCSASSPVITSTLSNRIFSTGLETQAAADSISVAFFNKGLSVGKKKEILSVQGIFWEYFLDNKTITGHTGCDLSNTCGIWHCLVLLISFWPKKQTLEEKAGIHK